MAAGARLACGPLTHTPQGPAPMRSVHRHLSWILATVALSACDCGREAFTGFQDAGPPPDAGQPDAGPPPPEFPLKPGDLVQYSVLGVTKCNESFGACMEKSTTWLAEYTVQEPGA